MVGSSDPLHGSAARRSTVTTLWTVQWLRAAAALLVVVGHSQSAVAGIMRQAGATFARSTVLPWGAGVDLFFVISGFIMVHAARRLFGRSGAAVAFLRRRITRIIPLYWTVTTLFLLILAAAYLKGGDALPSLGTILASYAFIPHDAHDGLAFPVFDLGWTLEYEMFFYVLFAGVLATGWARMRGVVASIVVLIVLVLAGAIVPAGWTPAIFWSRPIILDFALGLGVGLAMAEGMALPKALRWTMVAAGMALLCADPFHVFNGPAGTTVANGWLRVLVAGTPAGVVLAGAVLGPLPGLHRRLAPLVLLGDASYSLYLLHPFVLIVVEKAAQKSAAFRALPGGIIVAGAVIVAVAVAVAAYRWIERPVTQRLGERLGSAAPAASRPASRVFS